MDSSFITVPVPLTGPQPKARPACHGLYVYLLSLVLKTLRGMSYDSHLIRKRGSARRSKPSGRRIKVCVGCASSGPSPHRAAVMPQFT